MKHNITIMEPQRHNDLSLNEVLNVSSIKSVEVSDERVDQNNRSHFDVTFVLPPNHRWARTQQMREQLLAEVEPVEQKGGDDLCHVSYKMTVPVTIWKNGKHSSVSTQSLVDNTSSIPQVWFGAVTQITTHIPASNGFIRNESIDKPFSRARTDKMTSDAITQGGKASFSNRYKYRVAKAEFYNCIMEIIWGKLVEEGHLSEDDYEHRFDRFNQQDENTTDKPKNADKVDTTAEKVNADEAIDSVAEADDEPAEKKGKGKKSKHVPF